MGYPVRNSEFETQNSPPPSDTGWRGAESQPTLCQSFIVGLCFYTRLPLGHLVPYSQAALNASSRFLSLYGMLIGSLGALITAIMLPFFSVSIAVLLGMVATVLLTGAFHEDGLADVADGFGGGWQAEQVLTIMKDSRVGTYGSITLFFVLFLKGSALAALCSRSGYLMMASLIVAHALSRGGLISTLSHYPYVQADKLSKAKPVTESIPSNAVLVNVLTGIGLSLFFFGMLGIPLWIASFAFHWVGGRAVATRLGGYTGDCLGAIQQIVELMIYLVICGAADVLHLGLF